MSSPDQENESIKEMKKQLDKGLELCLKKEKRMYWFACHNGNGSKNGEGVWRKIFENLLIEEYIDKQTSVLGFEKDTRGNFYLFLRLSPVSNAVHMGGGSGLQGPGS